MGGDDGGDDGSDGGGCLDGNLKAPDSTVGCKRTRIEV